MLIKETFTRFCKINKNHHVSIIIFKRHYRKMNVWITHYIKQVLVVRVLLLYTSTVRGIRVRNKKEILDHGSFCIGSEPWARHRRKLFHFCYVFYLKLQSIFWCKSRIKKAVRWFFHWLTKYQQKINLFENYSVYVESYV